MSEKEDTGTQKVKPQEVPEESWRMLQQLLGYSDEQLEAFRKHPKKSKGAAMLLTSDNMDWTMVFEVVHSHGCSNSLRVGDKLFFTASGLLDTRRSSPWCSLALSHTSVFTNIAHALGCQGINPHETYFDHVSCLDCGSEFGWGQVIMKIYWLKEPGADMKNRMAQEKHREQAQKSV